VVPGIESGNLAPVPVLLGVNTNEGETFVYGAFNNSLPMPAYELAVDFVFKSVRLCM
jgi:hypothetical protein